MRLLIKCNCMPEFLSLIYWSRILTNTNTYLDIKSFLASRSEWALPSLAYSNLEVHINIILLTIHFLAKKGLQMSCPQIQKYNFKGHEESVKSQGTCSLSSMTLSKLLLTNFRITKFDIIVSPRLTHRLVPKNPT